MLPITWGEDVCYVIIKQLAVVTVTSSSSGSSTSHYCYAVI